MDTNASMSHYYDPIDNSIVDPRTPARVEPSDDSLEAEPDHEHALLANTTNPELWSTTRKKRGRQPKDPHAESIRFDCKDVEDMQDKLRKYLEAPTAPAEHATIEFHFTISAAFMVYSRDYKRGPDTPWTAFDVPDVLRRTAVSVHDVMQPTENPKEQIIRQKAVARICVEAIQKADGFRYSFHNNWLSREDKAHRFSFFCNDSTLNKGRAAGGGVKGSGKEPRKPIYECQGLIAVKFSITKNNLEVHYRHVPVHRTYEERAPPPRKESKRYRLLELLNPDALHNVRPPPRKKAKTTHPDDGLAKGAQLRRSGTDPSASTPEQGRERSLQPLIDFLGSADRVDSNRGVVVNDDGLNGPDGDTNRHNLTGVDEDDQGITATDDDVAGRVQSALVLPPEDARELQAKTISTPKQQKKKAVPDLPGMMAGSVRAGSITWADGEMPVPKKGSRKKRDSGEGRGKNQSSEPLAGIAAAAAEPLSEIEALKQKLVEAEQRIQRLETEKRPPLPSAYPSYPPYPYQYPYPPPHQGYRYSPYAPPPAPPQNNHPPALLTQHYPSSAGSSHPPPPTYPRTPAPAISPAHSQPPTLIGPIPSPAQSRPPNSAGPIMSPATPQPPQPTVMLTQKDSAQPNKPSTVGVNILLGCEPSKQCSSPVTPVSASQQQPSGGILKLVPNSAQMQVLEAAKMRNAPAGTSVFSANTPPALRVNAPKEPPVHYSPVPTITALSWAPVAISNQGPQSAQSQRSKWRFSRTSGGESSPIQQQSQTGTPLTATPMTATPATARTTPPDTLQVEKDVTDVIASTPAAPTIVENVAAHSAGTVPAATDNAKESRWAGIQVAAEKEPEKEVSREPELKPQSARTEAAAEEPQAARMSGTDAPPSAYENVINA